MRHSGETNGDAHAPAAAHLGLRNAVDRKSSVMDLGPPAPECQPHRDLFNARLTEDAMFISAVSLTARARFPRGWAPVADRS